MKLSFLIVIFAAAVSLKPLFVSGQDAACPLQCYNDGQCVYTESAADFHCECPTVTSDGKTSTFTGTRCETPSLVCEEEDTNVSYLCLNGGSCNLSKENCDCPDGFSGAFCQNGPKSCLYGGVCYNGGQCRDRHNKKQDECDCPFGTKGDKCETLTATSGAIEMIDGFSNGIIAAIAIGTLAGVLVLSLIARLFFRRCTKGDIEMQS